MTSGVASRRDSRVRRLGFVYAYDTLRPEGGYTAVEVGYVGQTRNRRARDAQHREDKPWADIIVGSARVVAQGWWSDDELDAAERAAIGQLRPRYNIACNEGNPLRIPPWAAREQRVGRDAARGVPAWTPPMPASVQGSAGWWPCPVWQMWAAAYVPLWVGMWWALRDGGVPVWPAAGVAAVSAGLLLGWGVRRGRRRPRRRRRGAGRG